MGLRTPEQYLESLRDGRAVYYRGELVPDVTAHPELSIGVRHAALEYASAQDPAHADLCTYPDATGAQSSRYFKLPEGPDDLLRRHLLIEHGTRVGHGVFLIIKEIGSDFLFAHTIVSHQMQEVLKAPYRERLRAFHRYVEQHDLALAVAQTDVKGDRSLGPSEQEHPDYYVHIVDRQKDGIVVRGAKAHTTDSVAANELIVIPTRALSEADRDYAVAFAVPMNTKGLKLITSPFTATGPSRFHHPVSADHKMIETLTVFDDVFVPWERVFLAGETPYAGALALGFVQFHRFTAVSYKLPHIDLMIGAAMLAAEANGIDKAGHVREKLSRLIAWRETVRGLTVAAAYECRRMAPGVAVPNPITTNVAKQYFAENYHAMAQKVQDIAGGLLVTGPAEEDLTAPETKAYVERYLGGKRGFGATNRLRIMNLIRDLLTSDFGGYNEVLSIHAEGSLEAQKLTILREFDAAKARAFAAQCAYLGA
ncbi:MAG TPA: 4-hydroxyphenylacetate 3-hydroxylase N-terminal domain-containing protein [Methylomirabilota bacterium]|jgi:aromatic ring hydroxylase|nr:4-hydroxyphenylacetate 3-hydroxylase N-terminal domain-containing protein [Methylomirabilota bacterium]